MLVVTGGAGFIGSNVVRALNARGETDIIVVDDLSDGRKFTNLARLQIADYVDYEDFLQILLEGRDPAHKVRAVLHQGACAVTTEWDGRYMMRNNFEYSKQLLRYCVERHLPLIYASSAAVYGGAQSFSEDPANERPLNVYGYSKLLFDQYVRRHLAHAESQVVGLRYFNVYGPGEAHKDAMASVAWHLNRQLAEAGEARLFMGGGGYEDGEQRRDFVYVDDIAAVNLWFLDHPGASGIFNVGTGASRSFNELARALIARHGQGTIRYIPFPVELEGSYQHFTEADLRALRAVGYDGSFTDVPEGVQRYLEALER